MAVGTGSGVVGGQVEPSPLQTPQASSQVHWGDVSGLGAMMGLGTGLVAGKGL